VVLADASSPDGPRRCELEPDAAPSSSSSCALVLVVVVVLADDARSCSPDGRMVARSCSCSSILPSWAPSSCSSNMRKSA
jgi:hypothetical protein